MRTSFPSFGLTNAPSPPSWCVLFPSFVTQIVPFVFLFLRTGSRSPPLCFTPLRGSRISLQNLPLPFSRPAERVPPFFLLGPARGSCRSPAPSPLGMRSRAVYSFSSVFSFFFLLRIDNKHRFFLTKKSIGMCLFPFLLSLAKK